MLTQHGYSVTDTGELVTLKIGSWGCSMEFSLALMVSAMLKREARAAKASAGFGNWHQKSAMAFLHDANAPAWKQARWKKLPDRLKKKNIQIYTEGQLVVLQVAKVIIKLPWTGAQLLSQSLRIHGRRARNFGGETMGWMDIVGREVTA